jgi:hypothetical protein
MLASKVFLDVLSENYRVLRLASLPHFDSLSTCHEPHLFLTHSLHRPMAIGLLSHSISQVVFSKHKTTVHMCNHTPLQLHYTHLIFNHSLYKQRSTFHQESLFVVLSCGAGRVFNTMSATIIAKPATIVSKPANVAVFVVFVVVEATCPTKPVGLNGIVATLAAKVANTASTSSKVVSTSSRTRSATATCAAARVEVGQPLYPSCFGGCLFVLLAVASAVFCNSILSSRKDRSERESCVCSFIAPSMFIIHSSSASVGNCNFRSQRSPLP